MQVYYKTDIGLVRSSNQDACKYGSFSDDSLWVTVCDGMGGANGGSVASNKAVEEISRVLCDGYKSDMTEEELGQLMRLSIDSANTKVYSMSCENLHLRGMGTTVELVIVRNDNVYVAHAGDSRVYIATSDSLMQLTTDHSIVQQLVDSGQITPEEARFHPSRNYITRALGVEPELEVDFISSPFNKGDVLMLCTDGLTNYFKPSELFKVITTTEYEKLAEHFVQMANDRGGSDNITVAIIVDE